MTILHYRKMNGLGNEIVVVDLRGQAKVLTAAEAQKIAENRGSHFDQLMVLHDARIAGIDAAIKIYNTDGSSAGACGNGMRCVGWIVAQATGRKTLKFLVGNQMLPVTVEAIETITVDMGPPKFGWADIPLAEPFHDTRRIELQIGPIDAPILHTPSAVSMGNPHAIFWVQDVDAYDLGRIGPMLENHPIFPQRANITLAHVAARNAIRIRTWERGAGLTKACGSASCAALVAAARLDLTDRQAAVIGPSGQLQIVWNAAGNVLMSGPAEFEHEGTLEI